MKDKKDFYVWLCKEYKYECNKLGYNNEENACIHSHLAFIDLIFQWWLGIDHDEYMRRLK